VRGVDDAHGYPAEVARRRPRAHPDRARTVAGDVAEGAPKGAQARPTGIEGDVGDGQLGFAQQRHRPLDAPREQVAVRRDAEGLLERPREVGPGDAAHLRQPRHRPCLVRCSVHPVLRPQEPAQQFRILDGRIAARASRSIRAAWM